MRILITDYARWALRVRPQAFIGSFASVKDAGAVAQMGRIAREADT